jgi:radical SAM protein with 4Fe4S-binding SPASM domain
MKTQNQPFLPQAYKIRQGIEIKPKVPSHPRVVFIEITNHCNLRCETCPRTFLDRESLKFLSYEEFVFIADQFPEMQRVSLHGIGEPLLNKQLPQMVRYLKARDIEVLINSNGTLLTQAWQRKIIESGLDEYHCSVDGATNETYARIRGKDLLPKVIAGLQGLIQTKERLGSDNPRISIWCVATKENLAELPDLIRLAARINVPEVYLQRLVFFAQEPEAQYGMALNEMSIFGNDQTEQEEIITECEALSNQLGVRLSASGARDPRNSLAAARSADYSPWQNCTRPWTTAYVTVNGNCLPCCISPFATNDYDSLIMGNIFKQPFDEIWNNDAYQKFRTKFLSQNPHQACASCGIYWSL